MLIPWDCQAVGGPHRWVVPGGSPRAGDCRTVGAHGTQVPRKGEGPVPVGFQAVAEPDKQVEGRVAAVRGKPVLRRPVPEGS